MPRLIQSPEDPTLSTNEPVVFLAGPILGALDWQHAASRLLVDYVNVANPRSETFNVTHTGEEQINWESKWLRRAAFNGCILFWLAKQTSPISGRSFGQTTRFELGEWVGLKQTGNVQLVVGGDPDFHGLKYIQHRLSGVGVPIVHSSLADTCRAALRAVGIMLSS